MTRVASCAMNQSVAHLVLTMTLGRTPFAQPVTLSYGATRSMCLGARRQRLYEHHDRRFCEILHETLRFAKPDRRVPGRVTKGG